MSVNGGAARRDMWAGRIERCLASGMAIGEWCSLNKVNRSSMYRWLAVFREEEPGRLGGKNSETSGWVKVARQGIAAAKAIVPAASAAGRAAADTRIDGPRRAGHTGGRGGTGHSRGDVGGGVAVSPFSALDAIYISKRPQDMRAGIQRLALIAAVDFGRDPMDGALYCFVSRDCEKMKLLRFDLNGWCMYYVRLSEGCFKWRHEEGGELLPHIERRQLLWLLEGLPAELPQAAAPVAAGKVL